ncbi:MAG: trigger factor [Bacteroidales bacterium]
MNITEEKTGNLAASLKIEVSHSDYVEQYENELKKYRKQANIPGFRPGKVPMGIIEKKYGTAILAEEINKLVMQELNDYIVKNEMDLLGHPIADMDKEPQDFKHQKDFKFYFNIAYSPEFDVDLSENTVVDYFKIKVDETIVDRFIDDIRKKNGEHKEVDTVEADDMLEVKITELENGEPKEEGISSQTSLLPRYIKDEKVNAEILGSKVGDKITFNPLKATGNATETASLLGIKKEEAEQIENDFEFEITKITRQVPAELNTDLYQMAFPGSDIETEEAFRERVREEASKAYAVESDKFFTQMAMDKLMEDAQIELPDEFLKKWLYVTNEGKISLADIERDYKHYRSSMIFQLVENKLVKNNEELVVKDEDIKNEIKRYLTQYMPAPDEDEDGQHAKQLDALATQFMQNEQEAKRINEQLFEQRLGKFLKEKLALNEQEVSYDDFIKKIQDFNKSAYPHPHNHEHEHDHEHEHQSDETTTDEQEK